MSNRPIRKHHSPITKKAKQKLFRSIAPIIVAITILCLSATQAPSAQKSPINPNPTSELFAQSRTSPAPGLASGNQITLNGRTLSGAWLQQRGTDGQLKTHLSDGAFRQFIGVDFLSSNSPARQPVEWFSSVSQPLILATRLLKGYRYVDITNFAQTAGWQFQANGNILAIAIPPAQVKNIRQSQQPSGVSNPPFNSARIVLDLDRPVPWQLSQGLPINRPVDSDGPTTQATTPLNREWVVILEGTADPALIQQYAPPTSLPQLPAQPTPEPLITKLEVVNNRTLISLSVPFGMSPQVMTLANPNRLVIDLRADALVQRDITWASGLRWRQQLVNLGTDRFPVVWLDINPRQAGLTLKPIGTEPNTQTGTAPLIQMAQQSSAVAAINAGYFNRNNRLPLGAIRRDNQWLSGPILNRGAIAWNDSGQFYLGRLTLQETLIAPNNQRLPILFLNSGYVQSGIARYTPTWGSSYTPLTDNEVLIVVQKDRVTNQLPGGKAGETAVPIPSDGYLLTLRANSTNTASKLPIGTAVSITSSTNSAEFNRYHQIMGAGPLLVQNNKIVLDAEGEKFSKAFSTQKAIRSGICTTASGSLMIAAVHNRAGGLGPTLAEHAQLMKNIGCVNALNLDGGSSTSLYLGGQLLDRSPNTAARVHNGIGVFLQQQ
ncbi:phosphodiester glycosidase family protein [Anabaena sp. CCY 0017]|uniref:phosphodiester glycosidase family protein n=1 Tax=Anabaena sp. CCY 0017 TaxID=3103866 RepID=UPI0039C5F71F